MDIFSLIKKLHDITPDPEYTDRSKRAILGLPFEAPRERVTVGRFILNTLQFGSAIALASFLIMLVFGGFSIGGIFEQFRMASLDPQSLRAEADAIDIQIKIAELSYTENTESTPMTLMAAPKVAPTPISPEVQEAAEALGLSAPQSSSSETVTIDSVLRTLAE